jgi:PiT family inorganic phosphate transporter
MNLLFPPGLSLVLPQQYQLKHSWGGWRIVKTMAFRITELKPYQGFCAETEGGVILTAMAGLGIPVSTTQAISGAIM